MTTLPSSIIIDVRYRRLRKVPAPPPKVGDQPLPKGLRPHHEGPTLDRRTPSGTIAAPKDRSRNTATEPGEPVAVHRDCRTQAIAYGDESQRGGRMAPRRIFVPHIHEDDEHVDALRQFLNRSGREADVSAIDSSRPNNAHDAGYIMSRYIRPKVEWCEAIVVLISPATQGSEWVQREIELARQLDRRIIGVWIPGSEGCPIPEGLQDYADAIVSWSGTAILGAIDGKINNIRDASGKPIAPQDIRRHNC